MLGDSQSCGTLDQILLPASNHIYKRSGTAWLKTWLHEQRQPLFEFHFCLQLFVSPLYGHEAQWPKDHPSWNSTFSITVGFVFMWKWTLVTQGPTLLEFHLLCNCLLHIYMAMNHGDQRHPSLNYTFSVTCLLHIYMAMNHGDQTSLFELHFLCNCLLHIYMAMNHGDQRHPSLNYTFSVTVGFTFTWKWTMMTRHPSLNYTFSVTVGFTFTWKWTMMTRHPSTNSTFSVTVGFTFTWKWIMMTKDIPLWIPLSL